MDDGYSYLWLILGLVVCLAAVGILAFLYWKSRQDKVTEEDI